MANAASLTNFSSPSLDIGDWLYSIYPRSAPGYLPLNSATTSYLQASYPTLSGLLGSGYKIVPVSTTGTTAASQFRSPPVYNGTTWVAANDTLAQYKTSTDGLTWTTRTGVTAATANARSLAYGAGVFVAVGNGAASSSPDGITWTNRASFPATLTAFSVVWNGSLFVCVGSNAGSAGTVAATSPDGITWTSRTIVSGIYTFLAYGAGLWVALSGFNGSVYGSYATSPDGITWTSRLGPNNFTDGGLVFANGFFLMMATNSSSYHTSADGINWTSIGWGGTRAIASLVFGDGVYALCDNNSTAVMRYSTDAITWFNANTAVTPFYIAPSTSGNFFYTGNGSSTPYRENLTIGTTSFFLPVVTALTNTSTYVKAT